MAGHGLRFRIPVLRDEAGSVVAAAPGISKPDMIGDYGPENHWIRHALRQGLAVLPKFQLETPLTPVSGPRLLTHPDWPRAPLAGALLQAVLDLNARSSSNALTISRMTDADAELARKAGMIISHEVASVWHNDGYVSHTDFLSRLKARLRYDLTHERRIFRQAGVKVRVLTGSEIRAAHWDAFHAGYRAICAKHHDRVLLNRAFFDHLAPLGDDVMLLAAFSGETFRSGTLCVRSGDRLLCRNWSEVEPTPNAMLELGLHLPIDVAIDLGLTLVDCGVWGAHKSKRGYEALAQPNAHWLRHPGLHEVASTIAARHHAGFLAAESASWRSRHFRVERAQPDSSTGSR